MHRYISLFAIILMGILFINTYTHKSSFPVPDPGYRPLSDAKSEHIFRRGVGTIEITVFPTVIRYFNSTTYDESSMKRIGAFLEHNKIAQAHYSDHEVNLSNSVSPVQWELFQNSILQFSKHLKASSVNRQYALLVEILVTPKKVSGEAIGGVQCYILDSFGKNVFSFLLNSHHQLFYEAQLSSNGTTEEEKVRLIEKTIEVVLKALRLQLDL